MIVYYCLIEKQCNNFLLFMDVCPPKRTQADNGPKFALHRIVKQKKAKLLQRKLP